MDLVSFQRRVGMRLRSTRRGRESWQVDILIANRPLASAVEAGLRAAPGVASARTNSIQGRVDVAFVGDPPADSAAIVAHAIQQALVATTTESNEWRALARLLWGALDGGDRLAWPLALTLFSHLVHIAEGSHLVSTTETAREASGGRNVGARSRLPGMRAMALALSTSDSVLRHQQQKVWISLARGVETRLREQLVGSVLEQDAAQRDTLGTPRLTRAIVQDVGQVGGLIDRTLPGALLNLMQGSNFAWTLLSRAPGLTLAALAPMVTFGAASGRLSKRSADATREANVARDAFNEAVANALAGLHDIKSLSAEQVVLESVVASAGRLEAALASSGHSGSAESHLFEGVFKSGFTLMASEGGRMVANGTLSPAAYTKALYAFPQLMAASAGLQGAVAQIRAAGIAAKDLVSLIDMPAAFVDGDTVVAASAVVGELQLEQVSFAHPNGRVALEGIDLVIPGGALVGIVGPTGAGKSTLLGLLDSMMVPTSGRILLDGIDIRTIKRSCLHELITFVRQDPYLVRGSVRANVTLGRPGATTAQIEEALLGAQALDFVRALPEGLETDIGERGDHLSGGQRQRLVLARAFLRKPRILLLDEATSQVDADTEAAVRRSIDAWAAGCTRVVVTHRLANVRHADRIVVIDQGRVIESGTHAELTRKKGLYAYLWGLQS